MDGRQILFSEETVLVYEGKEELTVLCGCSHPGICGMVKKAAETFDKPVHTLLGGVHLMNAEEERVQKTAETLAESGGQGPGTLPLLGGGDRESVAKEEVRKCTTGFHGGDRVVVEVR